MLVDDGQSGFLGGSHVARRNVPTRDAHNARIRGLQAAQHLGESGLAGPVLADQRMDTPRGKVEADVVKGPDGAE